MATNPCLCGYEGSSIKQCRCSPLQIENYIGKISGPLLDRIAVHVSVRPVDVEAWNAAGRGGRMASDEMREKVARAKTVQERRFAVTNGIDCNARIPEGMFSSLCEMDRGAEKVFVQTQKSRLVSARSRGHIVRIARTIADLDGSEHIAERHVLESVGYGRRDPQGSGVPRRPRTRAKRRTGVNRMQDA